MFEVGDEQRPLTRIQVEEPKTPIPSKFCLSATGLPHFLPQIPRRPILSRSKSEKPRKTIPIVPGVSSIAIERNKNHRIYKKTRRPQLKQESSIVSLLLRSLPSQLHRYHEHLRSYKHQNRSEKTGNICSTCKIEVPIHSGLERQFFHRHH